MSTKYRHKEIIAMLQRNGSVRTAELQEIFSVTTETLRRDLSLLEEQNILKKVHGGAILSTQNVQQLSFQVRCQESSQAKQIISELASQFIQQNDTIMLGSSTTSFYLAERITNRNDVTIITNSLEILNLLGKGQTKTIGLGGLLDTTGCAFYGIQTLNSLNNLYAKHSFVSCYGIDLELGITDVSPEEVAIKEKFLTNSEKRYLLADHSKLNKKGVFKVQKLKEIDFLITDKKPNDDWVRFFKQNSIELVYPE